MTRWAVVAGVLAAASTARADERLEKRWPALPASSQLKLEDKIVDRLSEIGNRFGAHLDVLSHDLVALQFDARAGRAHVRVGGGDVRYLTFRVDTHLYFVNDLVHVNARVDLGIAGHMMRLELPQMDVSRDSYHGQQLVQVNVPILWRRW